MPTARRVLDLYGAASGGLLAGGLAYAALVALVPTIVLVVGIAGLAIREPADRAAVAGVLAAVFPPLREVLDAVLRDAVSAAGPVTAVGAVVLLWGASRFVISFEDALARVMGTAHRRGYLVKNATAFGAVALLISALLATAILAGVTTFEDAVTAAGLPPLLGESGQAALDLLPPLVAGAALAAVYRYLPVPRPPWGAVIPPTVAVGLALLLIARAFAFVAPWLIGMAAVVGALASAFAALAWLALSFQTILVGAAWVRVRAIDEEEAPEVGPLGP